MQINANIPALQTLLNLKRSDARMSTAMQRLSSSSKINSVKDDPAGMNISLKMQLQLNGLELASRNNLDGISLVQTADGALTEVHAILNRLGELSIQAANGTYSPGDREKMQQEVDGLLNEINSIANRTSFNNIKLFDGSAGMLTSFYDRTQGKVITATDKMLPGDYAFDIIRLGTPATFTTTASTAAFGLNTPANLSGKLYINNEAIDIESGDTGAEIFKKLNEVAGRCGLELGRDTNWGVNTTGKLSLTSKLAGTSQSIVISSTTPGLLQSIGLANINTTGTDASINNITYFGAGGRDTSFPVTTSAMVDGNRVTIAGTGGRSVVLDINSRLSPVKNVPQSFSCALTDLTTGNYTVNGNTLFTLTAADLDQTDPSYPAKIADKVAKVSDINVQARIENINGDDTIILEVIDMRKKVDPAPAATNLIAKGFAENTADQNIGFIFNIMEGGLKLQIGQNAGMETSLVIQSLDLYTLGLDRISMLTQDRALAAKPVIDKAIETVSNVRSTLGAYQNRFEYTSDSLSNAQINMTSSLSRIADADMAFETAEMMKQNVIYQAGLAVMSQANMRPQQLLQLLS